MDLSLLLCYPAYRHLAYFKMMRLHVLFKVKDMTRFKSKFNTAWNYARVYLLCL